MTFTSEGQVSGETLLSLAKTELEKRYLHYIELGWKPKTSLSLSLEDLHSDVGVHLYPAMGIS